jgi:hypothetical protein
MSVELIFQFIQGKFFPISVVWPVRRNEVILPHSYEKDLPMIYFCSSFVHLILAICLEKIMLCSPELDLGLPVTVCRGTCCQNLGCAFCAVCLVHCMLVLIVLLVQITLIFLPSTLWLGILKSVPRYELQLPFSSVPAFSYEPMYFLLCKDTWKAVASKLNKQS